jgi:hypothetical protein
MKRTIKHLVSAVAVAGFLFIAFGSDDEKITEIEISTQAPAVTVSASQLYADYEANGVAADGKYKGKVLLVTGKVNTIDRDIMDKIYITLKGDEYFGDIQCFFAESQVGTASQLSKGQTITLIGKCDGKVMNVMLKGCAIENIKPINQKLLF